MKNNHAARSHVLATITAAALLGLAAGSVSAAEPTKAASTGAEASAPAMRVYIDPATGKFRQPTEAELAAQAQAQASADSVTADSSKGAGVIITKRADGTMRGQDTEGRLMESVVATRAADGTISLQYVSGDGSSAHADAPANAAEEK